VSARLTVPTDIELATDHTTTTGRLYHAIAPVFGVVAVGGVGGGFDSPAKDLYARLGESLLDDHVSTLRVRFRDPRDLEQSIVDVLAGVDFLVGAGIARIALIGHSFGGAAAITAAGVRFEVRTVVTIATQSHGARIERLGNRSILLIHGTADAVLPERCSISLQHQAPGRAVLELIEGADHSLDSVADDVFRLTRDWLRRELARS
jgi:dienelactone hydrolase